MGGQRADAFTTSVAVPPRHTAARPQYVPLPGGPPAGGPPVVVANFFAMHFFHFYFFM